MQTKKTLKRTSKIKKRRPLRFKKVQVATSDFNNPNDGGGENEHHFRCVPDSPAAENDVGIFIGERINDENYDENTENIGHESDDEDQDLGDPRITLGKEEIEETLSELKRKGLEKHLLTMGGFRSNPSAVLYIIQRTAKMLIWTYKAKRNNKPLPADSVMEWFRMLIIEEFELLEVYVSKYLLLVNRFSASTILNHLTDINKAMRWFIWFRKGNKKCSIDIAHDRGSFSQLLTQLKSSFKFSLRKQREAKTIDNAIDEGQFPLGGIAQLQAYVEDDLPWAYSFGEENSNIEFDKDSYQKFLAILVAALYTFSPQGRIGGSH